MSEAAVHRPGPVALSAAAAAAAAVWVAAWTMTAGAPLVALAPLGVAAAAGGLALLRGCARGRAGAVAGLLIFVVFGLSLNFRSREYGATGLDWQNGAKLATWLLILGLAYLNRRRIAGLLHEPLLILAGLYGAVAFASALWSQTPAFTAGNALGIVSDLLLACLVVAVLGEAAMLRLVLGTLAAFAAVALAAAVVVPDMAWLPPGDGETIDRLRGLSGHPNVLGEQMAILLTLAVIARRERLVSRVAFVVCVILAVVALVLSNSRITLAAALVAWTIVALRRRGLLTAAVFIILGAVGSACLIVSFGGEAVADDLLRIFSRSGSIAEVATLTGRTDLWSVAFERIAQKPLLGWGFNGTEALFVGGVGRGFVGDPVNAHNMYIQAVLAVGILGALPAFAMLAILVRRMAAAPDPARDQVTLLVLLIGLGEVSIFATPMLLVLTLFLFLAREAVLAPPGSSLSRRSPP